MKKTIAITFLIIFAFMAGSARARMVVQHNTVSSGYKINRASDDASGFVITKQRRIQYDEAGADSSTSENNNTLSYTFSDKTSRSPVALDASTPVVAEAESTIRDADMAEEMVNYTKNNILEQAAQSMLSQTNQESQGVLQLLQ